MFDEKLLERYSAEPFSGGETFYAYAFNAQGKHHGASLPKKSEREVMQYIATQLGAQTPVHEIRICDAGDNLVMHIVGQSLVFPEVERNLWNPQTLQFEASGKGVVLASEITGIQIPEDVKQGGRFKCCIFCKEPFSDKNVFTQLGWRETQISGMCEKCFDNM
jgi:hypothetical protein